MILHAQQTCTHELLEERLLEELRLICQQKHISMATFGQTQSVEGKKCWN